MALHICCLLSVACSPSHFISSCQSARLTQIEIQNFSVVCINMFLSRAEYDRGVNTFSPEGRLFQVEYAVEAINFGSTAIGVRCNEGVLLVAEKRLTSPMIIADSIKKIVEIDAHIACVTSGLSADSRIVVERARIECLSHWFVFDERMSVESCVQSVSTLAVQFGTDKSMAGEAMSRPFGVAMLFAGVYNGVPELWHMDPSGTYTSYGAKVIGSGSGGQQQLQDGYDANMPLKDGLNLAVNTLKQVMENKLTTDNFEVMTLTTDSNFDLFEKNALEQLIADAK